MQQYDYDYTHYFLLRVFSKTVDIKAEPDHYTIIRIIVLGHNCQLLDMQGTSFYPECMVSLLS